MARSDWGPLLDSPGWKALKRVLEKRRAEYLDNQHTRTREPVKNAQVLAEDYGRIEEIGFLLREEFAGEKHDE